MVSCMPARTLIIFLFALLFGSVGHTQPVYQLEPERDWLLLGSGCALTLGGLIAYENVKPLTLDEIRNLDRTDINRFDRGVVRPFRDGLAGDVATGASMVLPFTLLASHRIRPEWKTIGVMWSEVLLLQTGVNAIVKSLTKRVRPYAYDPGTPLDRKGTAEARVSFYSGHTGTSAAMSFFTARLYSGYFPGRKARVLVWGAAAVYPALIGIERIRSGQHFPSDVITGYLVGAAIGYVVPGLHKVRPVQRLSVEPGNVDGTPVVRLAWRF
jgi:hypothetical protein